MRPSEVHVPVVVTYRWRLSRLRSYVAALTLFSLGLFVMAVVQGDSLVAAVALLLSASCLYLFLREAK